MELWTRDHEVMIEVIRPDAGICKVCDEPLTQARFAWDHRITDPMFRPGPWKLGEDSFVVARHTSGKEPCNKVWHQDYPKAQCPLCGAYEVVQDSPARLFGRDHVYDEQVHLPQ